jgi:hypothetical protein
MSRFKLLCGLLSLASSIWSGRLSINREVLETRSPSVESPAVPQEVLDGEATE